jgi:hypothetical protein
MIRIEFFLKNWALLKTVEIESQYVPKVGELIDGSGLLKLPEDEIQNFFVTKVIYEITKKEIIPVVTCRQWCHGSREDELKERGWLPNTSGNVIHDDEY